MKKRFLGFAAVMLVLIGCMVTSAYEGKNAKVSLGTPSYQLCKFSGSMTTTFTSSEINNMQDNALYVLNAGAKLADQYYFTNQVTFNGTTVKNNWKEGVLKRKDGQNGKSMYLKYYVTDCGSQHNMSFTTNVQQRPLHGGDDSMCSLKYGYTDLIGSPSKDVYKGMVSTQLPY